MLLIISLVVGVGTFLMLDTFSHVQQFDLIDASIIYYKNVSTSIPERPPGTLTYSLQRRFNELYGHKDLDLDVDILKESSENTTLTQEFHRRYLVANVNRLSKVSIISPNAPSTKFFSVNNEWTFLSPRSYINFFVLDEDQFYGVGTKGPQKLWKNCLYSQVDGVLEAIAYNEHKNLLAGSFNRYNRKGAYIRIYDSLECEYRNSTENAIFIKNYCSEIENHSTKGSVCKGLQATPQEEIDENEKAKFINFHNTIPHEDIGVSGDTRILNMAVTDNIIAYTTITDQMKIHYLYKHPTDGWTKHIIEYPSKFMRYKYHQNVGLQFLGLTLKKESQLLVVDAVVNERGLFVYYLVYKFSTGSSLKMQEGLIKQYNINRTDTIDPTRLYVSHMYDLFEVDVSGELNNIDVFNGQSLPNSVIKYNSKTKQILTVNLERYLLLIIIREGDVYNAYAIKDFEDVAFRIKTFDISPNGLYYSFLVSHKNQPKVFILKNEYLYDVGVNKLYLINFDYSIKTEEKTILDVKLIKNVENEMTLMLLLEAGEMATYSLHLGSSRIKGGLLDLIIEDDLDFIYIFLLLVAVGALIIVKFARSIRINVNIRRRPILE